MPEVLTAKKRGTSAPGGNIVEMNWDPITRIVGSLGIFTKINFDTKKVVECYSTSSIFRGYSVFMLNKDPRDAHFITSRICGICGDNHATCSVYAQNMAYGIRNPPMAGHVVAYRSGHALNVELARMITRQLPATAEPPRGRTRAA